MGADVVTKTSLEIVLDANLSEFEKSFKESISNPSLLEGLHKNLIDVAKEYSQLMKQHKPATIEGSRVRHAKRTALRQADRVLTEMETGKEASSAESRRLSSELKRLKEMQREESAIRGAGVKDEDTVKKLADKAAIAEVKAMAGQQSSFLGALGDRTKKEQKIKDAVASAAFKLHIKEAKAEEQRQVKFKKDSIVTDHKDANLRFRDKQKQEETASRHRRQLNKVEQTESIKDMMMMNSVVAAMTNGIPGAGLIQSGVYGFASGHSRAAWRRNPETGELEKASDSAALMGGLKGGGAALGLAALATAVGMGVQGSRSNEAESLQLAKTMGGKAKLGSDWQKYIFQNKPKGMSMEEAMGVADPMLRATRGEGGVAAGLKAQMLSGQGGAFAGLAGAMTNAGAFSKTKDVDPALAKAWTSIFATGIEMGFKSGDIAELIAGATAMANQQLLGTKLSEDSTQKSMQMAKFLGQSEAFQSPGRNFQMQQAINQMISGQGTPISQAISLQAAGLGNGKSYVQAKMEAEKGFLGEGGLDRLNKYMGVSERAFGKGVNDTSIMAMHEQLGPNSTFSSAAELVKLLSDPAKRAALSQQDLDATVKAADSTETQAYKAMIKLGDWATTDESIQSIGKNLGELVPSVKTIAETLKFLSSFVAKPDKEAVNKADLTTSAGWETVVKAGISEGIKTMQSSLFTGGIPLRLILQDDAGNTVATANADNGRAAKSLPLPTSKP